jgi:hypothetical protein
LCTGFDHKYREKDQIPFHTCAIPTKLIPFVGKHRKNKEQNHHHTIPSQEELDCDSSMVLDEVEITGTGNTELRYDPDSCQFIFNWKTPKLPGTCWDIRLTTTDTSSILAHFKLK